MSSIWKARILGFCASGAVPVAALVLGGALSSLWAPASVLPYLAGGTLLVTALIGLGHPGTRQLASGAIAFLICLAIPVIFVFAKVLLTGDLM